MPHVGPAGAAVQTARDLVTGVELLSLVIAALDVRVAFMGALIDAVILVMLVIGPRVFA